MITMAMIINADISWFKWVCSFLVNIYKFTFHHRQTVGFYNVYTLWKKNIPIIALEKKHGKLLKCH